MATKLQLDEKLVADAVQLGRHKSKKEAVTQALEEYIQRLRQLEIIDLFGSIEFDPDYDYKAQRKVR